MKPYKIIILIILIHLISLSLNANEKETINYNPKISLNNKITHQFNFCFQSNKILNTQKYVDSDLINTKEYLKKARRYLAMGITGVIFTSLAIPALISSEILLLLHIGISYAIAFFVPLLIYSSFLGIGIPFMVLGIINFRKYKYQKNPDPFLETDDKKNSLVIGLKFNLNS